jgi:hypothetical protein
VADLATHRPADLQAHHLHHDRRQEKALLAVVAAAVAAAVAVVVAVMTELEGIWAVQVHPVLALLLPVDLLQVRLLIHDLALSVFAFHIVP